MWGVWRSTHTVEVSMMEPMSQIGVVVPLELGRWVDAQLAPGQSRSAFVRNLIVAFRKAGSTLVLKEDGTSEIELPRTPAAYTPPVVPPHHRKAPDGWTGDWEGVDMPELLKMIGLAEFEGKSGYALRLRMLLPTTHPRKVHAEEIAVQVTPAPAPAAPVPARPARKKWMGA